MLSLLIQKELKSIIASPKFVGTFGTCAVLILLSVFIGIQEYRASMTQYETARQLNDQEMAESSSWSALHTRVYRQPDPMQIFVSGVHYDIGRFSAISEWEEIKLRRSNYSEDPIFAIFRFIDFSFVVQIALSLLAILFTYDAINGEREQGTLKLTFANPVPRVRYILGKLIGSWLGMVIPLLIPILLALLLVLLYRIPLTADHWLRIFLLIGFSLLFFTFFLALGLLVSARTRSSSVAFLLLLVGWVTLVLIIPRAGAMLAGQLVPVPGIAEIDSKLAGYSQERWDQHSEAMSQRYQERNAVTAGMSAEEREAYEDANMWAWLEEEDAERKKLQQDISEYGRKLQEDFRNRRAIQEQLAFILARFSPASAYQLAAMQLAGNDIDLKTRYEDAMQAYRTIFNDFLDMKRKESGGHSGMRISISSESGINISTGGVDAQSLDLSEVPRFTPPDYLLSRSLGRVMPDLVLLVLFTVLAFAGAFVGFLRYDVR
ncbi:MAG: ABC transporter permease subunit [Calditrichae bacterium]|nr:ABC transporter permease subunit [Calditrichota bacterium]MCB9087246.1 ABC transporter permease subunit [Calditrichia bacterium]